MAKGVLASASADPHLVPDALDDWNLSAIERLTQTGSFESDRHDFKADLPDAKTLTKLACAFANSLGGFMVFGVAEKGAKRPIIGLGRDSDFAHRLGQKISAEPSIYLPLPREIPLKAKGKVLYVAHVPRSDRAPHFPSAKEQRTFWKRSNQGCEQMSMEEIRSMFLNYEERRTKLKQLVVELDHNAAMLHSAPYIQNEPNLDVFETGVIDHLLVDAFSILQAFPQIIQELQGLRRQLHQLNTRRQLFLAEVARPAPLLGARESPVASYNQFIAHRSMQITESIKHVEALLESQFGVGANATNW